MVKVGKRGGEILNTWFDLDFVFHLIFFYLMITLCSRLGREGVKGERKGTEASGKEQLDHSENDASD